MVSTGTLTLCGRAALVLCGRSALTLHDIIQIIQTSDSAPPCTPPPLGGGGIEGIWDLGLITRNLWDLTRMVTPMGMEVCIVKNNANLEKS